MKPGFDLRGLVALVLAAGVVAVLIVGEISAARNPDRVLSQDEVIAGFALLGAVIGALSVFMGGNSNGNGGTGRHVAGSHVAEPHGPPPEPGPGEPSELRAHYARTVGDMSRPRTALAVAFAVILLAAGTAAGYWAGNRAGADAARAVDASAQAAASRAEHDLSASLSYDAQAQAAAAAAMAGANGICWAARAGQVVAIATPIKRPGGETCPRSAPRYSPVEPEPVGPPSAGTIGG